MIRRGLLLLALLAVAAPAAAQNIPMFQGGPANPGRVPRFDRDGMVRDSGPSDNTGPAIKEMSVRPGPVCLYDADTTQPGYHGLCVRSDGVTWDAFGTAAQTSLNFRVNGNNYTIPGNATIPTQILDTHTGPFLVSGTSFLVSSDGTLIDTMIGANVNYQAIGGIAHQRAGSVLTNMIGVAGYVLNDNTPGGPNKNSVALYGWAQSNVAGAWTWSLNTLCNTKPGLVAGANCYNEIDMNFANTADTGIGLLIQGGSIAQPAAATAFEIGPLAISNSAIKWGIGMIVLDGTSNVGLEMGALASTGASVFGQPIYLDMRDAANTKKSYILQAGPAGFAFSGTMASPLWQFNGNISIATGYGIIMNGEGVITNVAHQAAFGPDINITNVTVGNGVAPLHLGGSSTSTTIIDGLVQASFLPASTGGDCVGFNTTTKALYHKAGGAC